VNEDLISQFETVAASADYRAKEALDFVGDVQDIIGRQQYYIQRAIEEGLPPEVAHASAAHMAGAFFAPAFQAYYRSEHR
jgi:hypothetical protein